MKHNTLTKMRPEVSQLPLPPTSPGEYLLCRRADGSMVWKKVEAKT